VSAVEDPSPNGAAVATDGTNVTYTASNTFAGTDTFDYIVSDGVGGYGTNTVTVTVSPNGQGYNLLQVNGNNLTYLGIPGANFALEHTDSLSAPVTWLPVVTNQAAADGKLTFDTGGVAGFYRTKYVTGP